MDGKTANFRPCPTFCPPLSMGSFFNSLNNIYIDENQLTTYNKRAFPKKRISLCCIKPIITEKFMEYITLTINELCKMTKQDKMIDMAAVIATGRSEKRSRSRYHKPLTMKILNKSKLIPNVSFQKMILNNAPPNRMSSLLRISFCIRLLVCVAAVSTAEYAI